MGNWFHIMELRRPYLYQSSDIQINFLSFLSPHWFFVYVFDNDGYFIGRWDLRLLWNCISAFPFLSFFLSYSIHFQNYYSWTTGYWSMWTKYTQDVEFVRERNSPMWWGLASSFHRRFTNFKVETIWFTSGFPAHWCPSVNVSTKEGWICLCSYCDNTTMKLPSYDCASESRKKTNGLGFSVMSIGFLLNNDSEAVVWRGPKKSAMIKQFLTDVCWRDRDVLIIDTPPGSFKIGIASVAFEW